MESIVFQEQPALGSKIVVQSFSQKSDVKTAWGLGRENAPDRALLMYIRGVSAT